MKGKCGLKVPWQIRTGLHAKCSIRLSQSRLVAINGSHGSLSDGSLEALNAVSIFPKSSKFSACFRLLTLTLALMMTITPIQAETTEADTLLVNGNVYTVDPVRSRAEAIAITNGRISYVGTTAGAHNMAGKTTKVIDLRGKFVLPGFHDSHVHLIDGGVEMIQCDLKECETVEQILESIRNYAKSHGRAAWVTGGGWGLPIFGVNGPTKEVLDAVVSERPVYLESQDHHSGWANSLALRRAGITALTKDPQDGRIERLPNGEPSGTLRESAMDLVHKIVPPLKSADRLKGLELAQSKALEFGITSVYDAACDEKRLSAYRNFEQHKSLNLAVTAALRCRPEKDEKQVLEFSRWRSKYSGEKLHVNAAKIFADGVIEAKTAALLTPYEKTSSSGELNFEPAALTKLVKTLADNDFQIHIHAIGDRGVRASLDALEAAKDVADKKDLRNHIAHLELVDKNDLPRFRQLGVVANIQGFWAQPDKYVTELTEPFVGPERSGRLYPIRSLATSGATLVGGSDWPVTSLNPLDAIEVAITRRAVGQTKTASWLPDQAVDLPTMIGAYTINGATIAHRERDAGSIEVGKSADIIVLNQDLFTIPPSSIHLTKVVLTLIKGKPVFTGAEFDGTP